ncbi:MAG: bifunctional histidinol-phosphatase/imidazoleglycerol-phosphate dehydratase HisB [Candidatus Dasytiphilus stammeri]
MKYKVLFVDRDGTLITEPSKDCQVDSMAKLSFEPGVIPALLMLQHAGYQLVMVTNQDGLGTRNFPKIAFQGPHNFMLKIFNSQGIHFKKVLICPHYPVDHCECRKPKITLLRQYLEDNLLDKSSSYVIGDRMTDMELAKNMGLKGLRYSRDKMNWLLISKKLTHPDRYGEVIRNTKETHINVKVWLDREGENNINTGIGFFDHMLEQIAIHGTLIISILVKGDIYIDDHHTVEDTALALGEALRKAIGNKNGIRRFGFVLPMDECLARCVIDLSGRPHLEYQANFKHQQVGDLSTEMIEHFFRSISDAMACSLHLKTTGNNDHHRAESLFKAFGRTIGQAIKIEGTILPSSKGIL